MSKYLKVQNHDNLVRDTETGAIINTNKNQLNHYLSVVEKRKSAKAKAELLETRVSNLENKLDTIINLLQRNLQGS